MTASYVFLSGAVTMGFAIAGVFFLRFWRRSRDPLFLAFAVAFALLGLNQALLIIAPVPTEERSLLYLLRLLAFTIIIGAIVRKNRKD